MLALRGDISELDYCRIWEMLYNTRDVNTKLLLMSKGGDYLRL